MMRGLTCLSLIALFLGFTAQSNAAIDPESVIGVWLFDEDGGDTALDSSTNEYDGTINGEVKWVEGKFDKALEFDEEGDYVEVPPSPRFNPEIFTFSFWMFPHTIGGNNPPGTGGSTLVIANGNPGDGAGCNWWFEFWSDGNFNFMTCAGGCVGAITPVNTPNKWYFITGIYNGTEYELYVDGEFKVKTAHAKGALEKGLMMANALCPAGHGCDSGYYKGLLDDVAMFEGALSVDDINELMNRGVSLTLGLSSAVSSAGKLTTTWAHVKE